MSLLSCLELWKTIETFKEMIKNSGTLEINQPGTNPSSTTYWCVFLGRSFILSKAPVTLL